MTEPAFVTLNNIMCEPVSHIAELRIIARDEPLSKQARTRLAEAADELEGAYLHMLALNARLQESDAHRVALIDRLAETQKLLSCHPVFPSISYQFSGTWAVSR